ncbi:hypothetical protein L3X38_032504 [Prunus dulcis]|uniref:Uncharacterized protein n=1 Tax=Prunus dulcis TaxID=3755 RepID=A0AAD4VGG6_PRUDU|nr:hypothetical protein L3X38_032504 [Prunus dulcis]
MWVISFEPGERGTADFVKAIDDLIFMRSTVLEKEDLEEYTRQSCYQVKLSQLRGLTLEIDCWNVVRD